MTCVCASRAPGTWQADVVLDLDRRRQSSIRKALVSYAQLQITTNNTLPIDKYAQLENFVQTFLLKQLEQISELLLVFV
jgi:hypothetical protein